MGLGRAPARWSNLLLRQTGLRRWWFGQLSQDLEQFVLEPGVQHRIWCSGHPFGPHLASGGSEQRQQFGGATTDVLVRMTARLAFGLPGLTGLRNCLIWAGLVLAPERDAQRFGYAIGQVDEPLFLSVSGSITVTTPAFRLRCAVPVGHQVRVRWYELPASWSTRRMVLVPTRGKPLRRSARCSVVSDQVAVPSLRRFGSRCAVATICARALRL